MAAMFWRTLLVITMLCAAVGHAAEMYQWVDENGKRHFTDKPPVGIAAEKSAIRTLPTLSRPAAGEEQGAEGGSDDEVANLKRENAALKQRRQLESRYEEESRRRLEQMEEERRQREEAQRAEKEDKCKRLKDLAYKAYAFKGRYERECGNR